MKQTSIFDILYSDYKITKPIRLIELFAGYGSQALALKYLEVPFEHWKICEWAVKSIQAYKDIHFTDEESHFGDSLTKEDLVYILYQLGISSNYNEPMTKEQISRLNEKQLHTIYENIIVTNNLVNIQQVKGKDLSIVNTNEYEYILTYSFPCQDLSLAGKGKGMSDTSTRSGLLWEVERILTECYELHSLPQVLLMENVPQVHGIKNIEDFNKWKTRLEELGYKNYVQDLIATDYGIPQTRNRCFMVSILGDHSYTFPKPIPLQLKLKDMLEDKVDEKYFLSDAMIKYVTKDGKINPDDNFNVIDSYNKKLTNKDVSGCIVAGQGRNQGSMLMIKNATKKGYLEAYEGDGVNISSRMEHQRGNVQKDMIQTLDTMGGNGKGVVVKPKVLGGIGEKDSNKNTQWKQQNRIYDDKVAISVTTSFNPYYKVVINPLKGISGKSWQFEQQVYDENGSARTLKASEGSGNIPKVVNGLRIRKLTPKECFRLMGVKDEDFEKCAKNQSDSSLYHLAGDSIVVNVLMAIFKELL